MPKQNHSTPADTQNAPPAKPTGGAQINKTAAAKMLGISPRRLVELAADGLVTRYYANDPVTHRRAAYYDAKELADLATVRNVVPPSGGRTSLAAPAATMRMMELLSETVANVTNANEARKIADSVKLHEPSNALWLTPAEAADYSGLPESFLIAMIEAEKLPALDVGVRRGGRWRIAKRDIDQITAPKRR